MNIISTPIDQLKEYAKNARTHSDAQIEEISRSIKNFGFNDPIEATSDGIIVSGHGRLAAARLLGLTHVPVVTHAHLTKSNLKGYILAANRIAMNAGWDNGLLIEEFKELENDNFDLSLTGFTQHEIDELLNPEELIMGITNDDDCPNIPEIPVSRPGDVWLLGEHRLMCGSSTEVTAVDKLFNDIKPILMVTDPPYGVEYDPSWRDGADLGVGERSRGLVKNDDLVNWSEAYCLFPGDVCYVWHAGKFTNIVAGNLQDCGFEIVSQIIWVKQHFALSRGDYHWQHEPCWYVVRKGKKHNWRGKRDQATTWHIKNNNSFGNSEKEETWGHGTQKPMECMSRPIENNSKPGEWIYDPFGGSGTTLIACEKLGRKCVMMELDEKYCDVIVKRWEQFTGRKATLELKEDS